MAAVLYTQPFDVQTQVVDKRERELCFLFHGLLGSGTNLLSVARMIQEKVHPIVFDNPNHGKSPHVVPGDFESTEYLVSASIEKACAEHAARALAAADQPADQQIHLLGHSVGGKYAMLHALHNPQQVRSLVIMDIAPMTYPPLNLPYLRAYQEICKRNPKTRREAVQMLGEYIEDQPLILFLAKNICEEDGGIQLSLNVDELIRQSDAICSFPASAEGKTYEGPVLVLRAETTDYFTEESESYIQKYFPNYQLETVPQTSHILHVDNPEKVQKMLHSFYEKVIHYR